MTIYLSVKNALDLHEDIIKTIGGLNGIRNLGLLESAIHAPQQILFGQEMYKSIPEKSSVYLYHIIKNHPFNDGNKRTAFSCFCTFVKANGYCVENKNYLENLCVQIAENDIDKKEIIYLISIHRVISQIFS